jgi:hypothetical protein
MTEEINIISTHKDAHKINLLILKNCDDTDIMSQKSIVREKTNERRIQKIPIPYMKCKNKKEILRRWLKQKCSYSDDCFKDPGYSTYYKNEFGIMDGDGFKPFYVSGDIDLELNIGYTDYEYGDEIHEDDMVLEEFIDYIHVTVEHEDLETALKDKSFDERCYIIQKMTRKNILILPGSNHSNANYLFKRVVIYSTANNISYSIPFVLSDPAMSYKGIHKNAKMEINKEHFYEFLRQNSRNQ